MIFFDVDTQRDFMDADGALSVPQAETIKPNLERLLRAAGTRGITTISSRCAHEPGDAEFEIFPPHCLDGTRGAERVLPDLPLLPRREVAVGASADPQARLARDPQFRGRRLGTVVHPQPFVPHHRLQGHAHAGPGRRLLSRPARCRL